MCANSEGSGKTARIRRLACAFAGRLCNKYHNLMSWLINIFIAVALDETCLLAAVHFSMKNINQLCDHGHAMGRSNIDVSQ